MGETDGSRFGIVGRGRKLRQFAEDVRRCQRIRLDLRTHVSRTTSRTAKFSGRSSCCFDRSLLPSSGLRCHATEAVTLSALSLPTTTATTRWQWLTRSFWPSRRPTSQFIRQSHFHPIAIAQPSSLSSGIESSIQSCQFSFGRTQFLGGRISGNHVSIYPGISNNNNNKNRSDSSS